MKNIMNLFFSKKTRGRTLSFAIVIIAYIALTIGINTKMVSALTKSLLVPMCAYIVAAIALNIVVGFLGDLSLGQAGFMAVGAFSGAVAARFFAQYISSTAVVLLMAMVVGAVVAAVFGVIVGVPVLKLQGDYLAIVTLAFGQIIKNLVSNMYVAVSPTGIKMSIIKNTLDMTADDFLIIAGPVGITEAKRISTFGMGFVLILITLFVVYNVIYSKTGRAIMACRDNKIAAESVGINVSKYKLMAFVISAAFAGAAGTLYALNYSSIVATKFDFNLSIMILVYVVLGGLGNINGTIIATALLLFLPEKLRFLNNYRMLIYAIVLIAIMLIRNNKGFAILISKLKKKGAKTNE